MKKKLILIFVANVLHLLVVTSVFGQQWAEAMFPERRHYFGNVALGSESVYRFQFKNPYPEDVHITSVRSSCACTTPFWPKTSVKFGETAEIIAKLNTGGQFTGDRKATLTVVIDRPSPAQVQLQVTGYIRPDVVISPGMAEFGTVSEGNNVQKILTLKYAGKSNSNWELIGVECSNPHIHVKADEVVRSNGRVEYKIFVTILKTMPSGYVHDMVRFTTNDVTPNASVVMFPVHGFVTAPLVAKPSPLVVGFVQPGETIKKNIVLHSEVPFRITKVTSKDRRFQFAISDDKSNSIHVLPIAFTADSSFGALNEPIIIHTTLDGQKQMQLLTQGMVYDAALLDEYQGSARLQLAGRPQEHPPGSFSGQADHEESPPTFRDNQKIAGLPQSPATMQIRMMPHDGAIQDVSPQETPNNIAFNMNREENRSGEIAAVVIDVMGSLQETDEFSSDEIAGIQQDATNAFVSDLKIVPQLTSGDLAMRFETPDTTTPPQVVMQQKQEDSFVPTIAGQPQSVNDLTETPFPTMIDTVVEHANNGTSDQMTAVSPQKSSHLSDTLLPFGFQVVEDLSVIQQPVSPKINTQTKNLLEITRPGVPVEESAIEHTLADSSASSNTPLTFSKPSIINNLEVFTSTKPQPVMNTDAFSIVEDSQNSVSGNDKPLPTGLSPKDTRVISETPPGKIPPLPEMTLTQMPVVSPFTTVPDAHAHENEIIRQAEIPSQTPNQLSHRLSAPLLPNVTNATPGGLDSNLIAEIFRGTGISETTSDTKNSNVVQMLPQDSLQNRIHDEQGSLNPMELQPLQPINSGALNARLTTIAPISDERLEYEEWSEENTGFGQPDLFLQSFERNPRWNTANSNREQMTLDDALPTNMMGNATTPGARQLGPVGIVNGAPIPTGIPVAAPTRQPGSSPMIPNNMPNMTVQQIPQPSGNVMQRPSNVPQRQGMQQPQPGNSQQIAQMQTAQPRLTPQQVQQMQQMQRMQQMQEMQRMQMQQRQAAVGQQTGRTAAPPPQNRVAQNNPRPPQQQPLVVPPAPTVPNTPMMTPAPMFR